MQIHRSNERGAAKTGWLDTKYSFSFSNYYNPKRMGFGVLRVLNEDVFAAAKGFGFHEHDNMEIVTIVLEGQLEHKDNTGNHGVIKSGEVQAMSAGSGIVHSEVNPSPKEPVHLLQIWVETKEQNIKPSYAQKKFSSSERKNKLLEIVNGKKGSKALYIHQDARFLIGDLEKGTELTHQLEKEENGLFVFPIYGKISVEGKDVFQGDSAEITEAKKVSIKALEKSTVLVIEVPLAQVNQ